MFDHVVSHHRPGRRARSRIIDNQRLSTLANAYEREIVQFSRDLLAEVSPFQCMQQEMVKVGFEEVHMAANAMLGRIGSGTNVILMEGHADPAGAACLAATIYAGKLIHELGMYEDFTLWAAGALQHVPLENGIRPDCLLLAEPTNLRIYRGALPGSDEDHPLVRAAIATYEELFELPPMVGKRNAGVNGAMPGVPAVAFGPGDEETAGNAPVRHLLKAAQFYAAFPMMFVDAVTWR